MRRSCLLLRFTGGLAKHSSHSWPTWNLSRFCAANDLMCLSVYDECKSVLSSLHKMHLWHHHSQLVWYCTSKKFGCTPWVGTQIGESPFWKWRPKWLLIIFIMPLTQKLFCLELPTNINKCPKFLLWANDCSTWERTCTVYGLNPKMGWDRDFPAKSTKNLNCNNSKATKSINVKYWWWLWTIKTP